MIVVDASVAVKWFLPEPLSAAAEAYLRGPEKLIAPALIRIEVAAAITRKVRLGQLSGDDASAAFHLWLDALGRAIVTLSPDKDHVVAAVNLAIQLAHPLQDCLYLALANHHGARLITADLTFAKRARPLYPNIESLA